MGIGVLVALVPILYACADMGMGNVWVWGGHTLAMGCALPGCIRLTSEEPVRVKITRQHMPEQMQNFISAESRGQVTTYLTLCAVHHDEFRQLGWLDEEKTDDDS